jgi:acyl-CoA thioester hydrolase
VTDDLPIFELTRQVEPSEIDGQNHVNNVVYVQWANDIAVAHWENVGTDEMLESIDWVLLKHTIEYKQPAFLGDNILLRTQVGRATNVKYQRFIEMYNADNMQLLAKSLTDWCALDKSGKPTRITQVMRDRFEVAL